MKKSKIFVPTLFLICFNLYMTACSKEDYNLYGPVEVVVTENGDTIKYANKKQIITDFDELSYDNILIEKAFVMEKHAENSFQGLAIHEDYLLQTYHTKACVDVYDLTNNQFVFSMKQKAEGSVHCNNVDFGGFYETTDPFPLLYLENKGGNHKTSVYRIISNDGVFTLKRIQVINFKSCISCTSNNDAQNSWMYVTYHDSIQGENERNIVKIKIPDCSATSIDISLDSNIIIEKYSFLKTKVHQDATIYKNKFFQLKGGPGSGEIWIYDLIKHETIFTIDWNKVGMSGEPEGIGWYKDHLVITNNSGQVYNMYFVR